jgi:AcrR family transcriptional regulator
MKDRISASTRARLLEAATDEFAAQGLRGARIQGILRRARINERMIYHHFGSKDGLYRAVLAEQWSGVQRAWGGVLEQSAALPPRACIEAAYRGFFQILVGHSRRFMPLVLHEAMNGWSHTPRATLAQLPESLRAAYRRGQRDGVFRRDCTFEVLHISVMGLIAGLTLLGPRFEDVRKSWKDPDRTLAAIDTSISLLLDGAVCRPARPRSSAASGSPARRGSHVAS